MCDKKVSSLFGGRHMMQRRLVATVRNKMGEMEPQDLDKMCGFDVIDRDRKMARTADYLNNPQKMTSFHFSAASFALDVNVDEVFNEPLEGEDLVWIIDKMTKEGAGLAATCGDATGQNVDCKTQAPVYAILKALSEMDEIALS